MSALPESAPIEVLTGCKPGEIPEHVFESDVPMVLQGLVAEWPAVQVCRQSLAAATDYLLSFSAGRPVDVLVADSNAGGRFFYDESFTGFNFTGGTVPLPVVFEKLAEQPDDENAQTIYVGCTSVDQTLPGFREKNDITVPSSDVAVNAWMGNKARVAAHFDFPDNIACIVAGRRRFTLFPPDQIENLYIGPLDRTPAGQAISLVDLANPDLERFPKFEKALAAACAYELEPGDAIFIPSMWWHCVESLTPFNMLVNYWWVSTPDVLGAPMDALMHAILSVRQLPESQRKIWKAVFDHYVFSADESVYSHIPEPGRGCLAPLDDATARQLRAYLVSRLRS